MKSHIQAVRYQITPHSRRSIHFCYLHENPPVCHTCFLYHQIFSRVFPRLNLLHLTEFLRAFFWCIFLLGLRKKDTGKKAGEKCSPKLSQKYPSRENAILATQIPPSEKSNDSYKFVSLCASSGRQYFKFDLSLSFLLISFFEILNKTFVK